MSYNSSNNGSGDYNLNGRYIPQQQRHQQQQQSGTIAQLPPPKNNSNSNGMNPVNPQTQSNSYGYSNSNISTMNMNPNTQQVQAPMAQAPGQQMQGQGVQQQFQYQQPQGSAYPQQGYGHQQVMYGGPGGYVQAQPQVMNTNPNMNMGYNQQPQQQQQQPVQYNYQYGQTQPVTITPQGGFHNYGQSQMNMQYQPQYQQQQQFNQNAMPMGNPRRKVTLKLVILGNSGVGKTSFMNRYHSDKFTGQYKATIGADFLSKKITVTPKSNPGGPPPQPQEVILTIWDTAGQERFQSLGKAFYRGSDVCLLVFDVTDRSSFDGLQKWKEEFDSCVNGGGGSTASNNYMNNRIVNGSVLANNNVKCIVVGNKVDKDGSNRAVTKEEGMAYAKSIGTEYYEASAKTAVNVGATFLAAARAGLEYNSKKNMDSGMNMGVGGQRGMRGGYNGMKGYVPPQRTVDLNRGNNNMNDGDCC